MLLSQGHAPLSLYNDFSLEGRRYVLPGSSLSIPDRYSQFCEKDFDKFTNNVVSGSNKHQRSSDREMNCLRATGVLAVEKCRCGIVKSDGSWQAAAGIVKAGRTKTGLCYDGFCDEKMMAMDPGSRSISPSDHTQLDSDSKENSAVKWHSGRVST
ncbi:hypothetical protein BaRGS_00015627 [Batillaria attramentaria]|uniref:Uncharacterized protein n=1 Tax=Batillaria attramentaria TaxID=370345 RepID=A0ABD0L0S0_9CAEN